MKRFHKIVALYWDINTGQIVAKLDPETARYGNDTYIVLQPRLGVGPSALDGDQLCDLQHIIGFDAFDDEGNYRYLESYSDSE